MDVRKKNKTPEGRALGEFFDSYSQMVREGLESVDRKELEHAFQLISSAIKSGRRIYSAGNGGSAAIADHLCCDWTKGTDHEKFPVLRSQSLMSNVSLLTALANDFEYSQSISRQVKYYADKNDIVILISSSGNSPNVVQAAEVAIKSGAKVVGLTGFSGGKLNELADVKLHIPISNYGVVEDCHQSIMHVLAQFIARDRDKT